MKVKEIILHCTDTPQGQNFTVDDINAIHIQRGFRKIGYHYLIYLDGSIHTGRAETENGAHCKGHNNIAIGISYVGGNDGNGSKCSKHKHLDTRTAAQKSSMIALVKQLMQKYNLTESQVHCHYEFASKACPCFTIETFRQELRGETTTPSNVPIQTSSLTNSTSVYKKFKRGWLGGRTKWSISSPMGYRRPPKKGASRYHGGNDISTPVGTEIYAPCDGTVVRDTQGRKGGGLYIILKDDNSSFWFYFMHLSQVIKTGKVREGDLIAKTGGDPVRDPNNAGTSTGPHLHFEVRKNGDKSQRVDGKYFISDIWVNKRTGAIMTNSSSMPLITDNPDNFTQDVQSIVDQEYAIDESDIVISQEQDVSGEVDWDATEDDDDIDSGVVKDKELKEGLVSGIWQIMKLVMDSDVANLRIRDAATSLQQGSLINFFQKVCQQPFVEFFGDTYGDQYYFIARRPPFDKEGMKKTMVAQGLFNSSAAPSQDESDNYKGENVEIKTIYDIYEDDIVSSDISFNTQNIYSWYQFIPIYELGAPSELQYLIPAILFPEYAAIWGSRSLSVRSQYRNFQNSNISDKVKNGEKSEQGDVEVRHSIHDLKYIIESNAYNPFIRQGSITILGNRKIKRGTFIRVFWNSLDNPEIFYVESVAQNYSINSSSVNRTTTLTLSHGMLSDFMFDNAKGSTKVNIDAEKEDRKTISYFNLIDFGEYEQYRDKIDMDKWREIISKWKVNKEVFMFFLRKTQFLRSLNSGTVVVVGESKNSKIIL